MYVRVCVCACAGSECEPECMRVCVCNVYVCIWIGCWQNGDGTFSEGVSVVYVFVSVCASSFFVTQLLSLNYSQRLTRHTQIHRHTSVQKRADKVPANVSGSGFVGRYWNDTRTQTKNILIWWKCFRMSSCESPFITHSHNKRKQETIHSYN